MESGSHDVLPGMDSPAPPATGRRLVDVALNRPLRHAFTYRVPEALAEKIQPGVRVAVPFGRRREVGVVVGMPDRSELPDNKLRAIAEVLDKEPAVDAELLELTRWISDYYACGWGEALAAALPAALKREGGRRQRTIVSIAPGIGPEALEVLEDKSPKQHRLARTLLEASGPIERAELLKRVNVTAAPLKALVDKGLAVARKRGRRARRAAVGSAPR